MQMILVNVCCLYVVRIVVLIATTELDEWESPVVEEDRIRSYVLITLFVLRL